MWSLGSDAVPGSGLSASYVPHQRRTQVRTLLGVRTRGLRVHG